MYLVNKADIKPFEFDVYGNQIRREQGDYKQPMEILVIDEPAYIQPQHTNQPQPVMYDNIAIDLPSSAKPSGSGYYSAMAVEVPRPADKVNPLPVLTNLLTMDIEKPIILKQYDKPQNDPGESSGIDDTQYEIMATPTDQPATNTKFKLPWWVWPLGITIGGGIVYHVIKSEDKKKKKSNATIGDLDGTKKAKVKTTPKTVKPPRAVKRVKKATI